MQIRKRTKHDFRLQCSGKTFFLGNTCIKYLLFEHAHTGFAHGVSEKISNLSEVLQLIASCLLWKYLSCSLTYIALVKHNSLFLFHILRKTAQSDPL